MPIYTAVTRRAASNAPLTIAFVMFIALALPTSILNVAWQYMHVDLAQPYDALGILLLCFTAGRILSTFFAGRVLARLGMWRSVFTGMTIVVVGLLATALSPSWPILLAGMFTLAYGWGLMDIGVNLYVAALARRGILNFLHASYGIGLTLGPLIVTLFVVRLGQDWRLAYVVPLVVMSVLWLFTFISRDQWVLQAREDGTSAEHGRVSIRATLSLPVIWPWLLFALLYAGFEVGTGQLSSDLLTEARGLDAETASTWVSLYWAAFTGGRFLSGLIAGRFSERTMILGFTLAGVLGAVLLALPGLTLTLPGLLLMGISLAGVFPTLIAVIPQRFGLAHAPNIIGFTLAAANGGIAVIPGLGAFLAARTDFALIGPFLVAIGVLLVSSYLLILRRSPQTA